MNRNPDSPVAGRGIWPLALAVVFAVCPARTAHGAGPAGEDGVRPEPPALLALIRAAAHPLSASAGDYDPLMRMIGDARIVLLGESTHGSREFYRERARITRRLIEEKGFNAVVLEGNWPQTRRINEYVQGRGTDASAAEALSGIVRFPRWVWRNTDFRDFVEALRRHNAALPPGARRVGVYGMDLYSMPESAEAVIRYLEEVDPAAARRARLRYRCLSRFSQEPDAYGRDVAAGKARSCRTPAKRQFADLGRRVEHLVRRGALDADGELFSAWQNARAVMAGEAYYRELYRGKVSSWNLRDLHMADTLQALLTHPDRPGEVPAKLVVWAHNSHIGDARMTAQAASGDWNVGQLARERYGKEAVLVGFSTYSGSVRAASEWGGPDEVKEVLPALAGSTSALLHQVSVAGSPLPGFVLLFRGNENLSTALQAERLERFIGVLYLPETERDSHYQAVRPSRTFDALVHIDRTQALEPLP